MDGKIYFRRQDLGTGVVFYEMHCSFILYFLYMSLITRLIFRFRLIWFQFKLQKIVMNNKNYFRGLDLDSEAEFYKIICSFTLYFWYISLITRYFTMYSVFKSKLRITLIFLIYLHFIAIYWWYFDANFLCI